MLRGAGGGLSEAIVHNDFFRVIAGHRGFFLGLFATHMGYAVGLWTTVIHLYN